LFRIFADVEEHGYHGAASLNAVPTLSCKYCSNSQKNIFVDMERFQGNNSVKYICPECGREEPIKTSLTPKYLHKIHEKVRRKAQEVAIYSPIYTHEIKNMYKCLVDNNKEDFLERFREYENLASRDLLSTQNRYFIGHYNSTKRTKRKWCSIDKQLSEVKIDDYRYISQYLPLVDEAVDVHIYGVTDEIPSLLKSGCDKLIEIGWPERYIQDKINADCLNRITLVSDKLKKSLN
jgi:hypothetical protein